MKKHYKIRVVEIEIDDESDECDVQFNTKDYSIESFVSVLCTASSDFEDLFQILRGMLDSKYRQEGWVKRDDISARQKAELEKKIFLSDGWIRTLTSAEDLDQYDIQKIAEGEDTILVQQIKPESILTSEQCQKLLAAKRKIKAAKKAEAKKKREQAEKRKQKEIQKAKKLLKEVGESIDN